jgi:hypothetical protein
VHKTPLCLLTWVHFFSSSLLVLQAFSDSRTLRIYFIRPFPWVIPINQPGKFSFLILLHPEST